MAIQRADLTQAEWETLKRFRTPGGHHLNFDWQALDRLLELGLLEQDLDGRGLSRTGKELLLRGR